VHIILLHLLQMITLRQYCLVLMISNTISFDIEQILLLVKPSMLYHIGLLDTLIEQYLILCQISQVLLLTFPCK
jgi:hypothetical protein